MFDMEWSMENLQEIFIFRELKEKFKQLVLFLEELDLSPLQVFSKMSLFSKNKKKKSKPWYSIYFEINSWQYNTP